MTERARKTSLFFFILIYAAALAWLYLRYVPLVQNFQYVLAPILISVAVAAAASPRCGALFFVFFFPLINNLPYFFFIYEHIPHAPTSLVLFLFFFLGWLFHQLISRKEEYPRPQILIPMGVFSALVVISTLITVFRYTNFFPLGSARIFELAVNVNGVSAGGAIMSSVFAALNYLTGFAFFFILLKILRPRDWTRKILLVLLTSTTIAIAFGLQQAFRDKMIGNTPGRVTMNTVNATFLDPNALGGFLAAALTLFFALTFALPKKYKVFPLFVCLAGIVLLPYSGSISGILSLFAGMLIVLIVLGKFVLTNSPPEKRKRLLFISGAVFLLLGGLAGGTLFLTKNSETLNKFKHRISSLSAGQRLDALTDSRFSYFWNMAAKMTADYPLSGVGIGSYIIEIPNYSARYGFPWRQGDSAQNYFAQSGAELGLPGLFLSLWIWLEIFRQIKRRLKFRGLPLSDTIWAAGIAASLAVLFINYLVHTYIGSFDVKYLFWLLTACLFSHESGIRQAADSRLRGMVFLTLGFILIFGAVHLWNSTHTLSLERHTSEFEIRHEFGLDKPEALSGGRTMRWSGAVAGISLQASKPAVEIPVLASHPDIQKHPVYVKIFLYRDFFREKILLDKLKINHNRWQVYSRRLPVNPNEQVVLVFEVSRTWSPLKELGVQDSRKLGIALGKITWADQTPVPR
jgi:hypothetical protein